jgi:transcription elongation factor GreB
VSRAFVKEGDGDEVLPPALPALPPGVPNAITPAGADRARARLAAWRAERQGLGGSGLDLGRRRELDALIGAWEARAAAFRVVQAPVEPERVSFGCWVEVDGPRGRRRLQLVGVDEVEGEGACSWLSPLGRVLMGAAVGDVVRLRAPGGDEEVELVAITAGGGPDAPP